MNQHLFQLNSGFILLAIGLMLNGCVDQSVPKLEAAVYALEDARMSGAEDYAVEIYTEAEAAFLQAKDECEQQQDHLKLFRNYRSASAILAKALQSAAQAKLEAIANKEEAKANAEVALLSARQAIRTFQGLVESFPITAVDQETFDQLALTIQAAESLLAETESVMTEENYIGVMIAAHSIESFAGRIQELMISAKHLAAKREV